MERVNRIIKDPLWKEKIAEIRRFEAKRRFCGHGIPHLVAVARIAYIESMEQRADVDPEILYAAALLHDIGRSLEYTEGIPHEEAGFSLSQAILPQCGFGGGEAEEILRAVRSHRNKT